MDVTSERLRLALDELDKNRHLFTEAAHTLLTQLIMDALRAVPRSPSETDEIRLVTVMFVDIQDSIRLAQHMDTEDWKALLNQVHKVLATLIAEWEGEIGQYLGDGLLCFFGAHHSRGDEASRAVASALAIQRAMSEIAQVVRSTVGLDFVLRIGISTGRVVVGVVGSGERQEVLAFGSATNLAARLQAICPPGGVLIDSHTEQRVHTEFVTESRPPAVVKGFDAPVQTYAVLGRRSVSNERGTIAGGVLPFVGRDAELTHLVRVSEKLLDTGLSEIVSVHGEAGVGKTALLRRAVEDLDPRDFDVVFLTLDFERRATPHNFLRALLAHFCNLSDDSPQDVAEARIAAFFGRVWPHPQAESLWAVVGYLAGYGFTRHAAVQSLKASGAQERLVFVRLARWFSTLLASKPLVLIVDNAQWLDDSSLNLVRHLSRSCANRPWLLVLAMRPRARERVLRLLEVGIDLPLGQLDAAATIQLIESVLANVDGLPTNFAAQIMERTGGSPLFVEEFLRMLFGSGVFDPGDDGRWLFNAHHYDLAVSSLPGGLQGVLQARLDDLPPSSRRIVQIAAVVGHRFWGDLITELAGGDAQPALEDLVARGIIVHSAESRLEQLSEYAFRHILHREAAYAMLTRPKREHYHREIARWLRERTPGRLEFFPLLAMHFARGRQPREALAVYIIAVEDFLRRGFMDDVLKLTAAAKEVVDELATDDATVYSGRLLLARGQALNVLQRYDESIDASREAIDILKTLPEDSFAEDYSAAARTLGSSYRSLGMYNLALDALYRAYELLPDSHTPHAGMVLQSLGSLFLYRGDLTEAIAYLRRALAIAAEMDDDRLAGAALTQTGLAHLEWGRLSTALEAFEQALAINQRYDNLYYQAFDLRNIGMVYWAAFAYEQALEVFDKALELHNTIQHDDALLRAYRGLCMVALGREPEGMALLRRVSAMPVQDIYAQQLIQLARLQGMLLCGQYAEVTEMAIPFIESSAMMNPILQARAILMLGIAQFNSGDEDARKTLEGGLVLEEEFGGRELWRFYYALRRLEMGEPEQQTILHTAATFLDAMISGLETDPRLRAFVTSRRYRERAYREYDLNDGRSDDRPEQ